MHALLILFIIFFGCFMLGVLSIGLPALFIGCIIEGIQELRAEKRQREEERKNEEIIRAFRLFDSLRY